MQTGIDQETRNALIGAATIELLRVTDWMRWSTPEGLDTFMYVMKTIYFDSSPYYSGQYKSAKAMIKIRKSNPSLYEALKPWVEGIENDGI